MTAVIKALFYFWSGVAVLTCLFLAYQAGRSWIRRKTQIKPLDVAFDTDPQDDNLDIQHLHNLLMDSLKIPSHMLKAQDKPIVRQTAVGASMVGVPGGAAVARQVETLGGPTDGQAVIPGGAHEHVRQVETPGGGFNAEEHAVISGCRVTRAADKDKVLGSSILFEILKLRFKQENIKKSLYAFKKRHFMTTCSYLVFFLTLIVQSCGIL